MRSQPHIILCALALGCQPDAPPDIASAQAPRKHISSKPRAVADLHRLVGQRIDSMERARQLLPPGTRLQGTAPIPCPHGWSWLMARTQDWPVPGAVQNLHLYLQEGELRVLQVRPLAGEETEPYMEHARSTWQRDCTHQGATSDTASWMCEGTPIGIVSNFAHIHQRRLSPAVEGFLTSLAKLTTYPKPRTCDGCYGFSTFMGASSDLAALTRALQRASAASGPDDPWLGCYGGF